MQRLDIIQILDNIQSRGRILRVESARLFKQLLVQYDTQPRTRNSEAEIVRLVNDLVLIKDEQAGQSTRVDRLRTAIAPHKYLPSEILGHIFLQCLDSVTGATVRIPCRRQVLPLPWTLGHVCSRWRQIALAETCLWTSIQVDGLPHDLAILKAALTRSGQSTLRLAAREYGPRVSFIEDVILPCSQRIADLSLDLHAQIASMFLRLPSGLFRSLKNMELSTHRFPEQDISIFRGAISLRHITIQSKNDIMLPPPSYPLNMDLPWCQLTEIYFGSIPIQLSIVHEMLSRCTSVVDCCLLLDSDRPRTGVLPMSFAKVRPPASITLPRMLTLGLLIRQRREPKLYCDFLWPLLLPRLKVLNFILRRGEERPPVELAAIIEGLAPPTLRVELDYWGDRDIADFAGPLHLLVSIDAFDSFLRVAMMCLIGEGRAFPKMTFLRIRVHCANIEALLEMFRKRWSRRSSECLLSASIFFTGKGASSIAELFSDRLCDLQKQLGATKAKVEILNLLELI